MAAMANSVFTSHRALANGLLRVMQRNAEITETAAKNQNTSSV